MFLLICTLTNGWVNNRDAGDLRHDRAHYDITAMICFVGTIVTTLIGNTTKTASVIISGCSRCVCERDVGIHIPLNTCSY